MLLRLAGGLAVATALFWTVSRPFLDSVPEYAVDAELGGVTYRPGHTFRFRSEGRGTTRYGRFGIPAIEDVTLVSAPKIAIWGNSMVEAHQVGDFSTYAYRTEDYGQTWAKITNGVPEHML